MIFLSWLKEPKLIHLVIQLDVKHFLGIQGVKDSSSWKNNSWNGIDKGPYTSAYVVDIANWFYHPFLLSLKMASESQTSHYQSNGLRGKLKFIWFAWPIV